MKDINGKTENKIKNAKDCANNYSDSDGNCSVKSTENSSTSKAQTCLGDFTVEEMKELLDGAPAYRVNQLFKWVSAGAAYAQMSDLPKDFRERLSQSYSDTALKIIEEKKSADGSCKMLYKLNDGHIVEGIFMPHDYGNTVCVSTQVGCKMKCAFCASGLDGLVRNLSAGEIYGQVIDVNKKFSQGTERAVSNIVLMGSGEPLDNYEAVTKFIGLVSSKDGLNISQRSISLSTCGIPSGIRRLADDGYSVTLSLSLHATTDEVRQEIMPIATRYTIAEVMDAAKYYFKKSGRRIIIEYILISKTNTTFFDAQRLKELLYDVSAHINLIPLNYVKESPLKPAGKEETRRFLERLKGHGLSATIRRSLGAQSDGACGQLRRKFVGDKEG